MPTSTTERLRTVRRLYRRRGTRPSTNDVAYLVYVALLLAVLVAVPTLIGTINWLSEATALQGLTGQSVAVVVAMIGGSVLTLAILVGAVRGPVVLPPFFVRLLAGTDMPRHRALRRAWTVPMTLLSAGLVAIALIFSAVVISTNHATWTDGAVFAAAAFAFAVLVSVGWLAGQRLGGDRAWRLALPVLLAVLASWQVPALGVGTPWGWLGQSWPATQNSAWGLLALCAVALVSVGFVVPQLLTALDEPPLLRQAHQWQGAVAAAGSADFAALQMIYQARPKRGRRWKAVVPGPVILRFVIQDAIAAVRLPARFVVAGSAIVLGGFTLTTAVLLTGVAGGLVVIGTALVYGGLSPLTDGFRHAAQSAAAPALYGYSTGKLYALHAAFPFLVAGLAMVLGGALALVVAEAEPGRLPFLILSAVFLTLVRAYDSAKGPLPVRFLMPLSSPVGDLSGLLVLAWQADGLLAALIVVFIVAQQASIVSTAVLLIAMALVAVLTVLRLRRQWLS